MDDDRGRVPGLGRVAGLARAIRAEFGPEMDHEYPGLRDPAEAGPVNRAFRAAAGHVLRASARSRGVARVNPTSALLCVARGRLAAEGLDDNAVAALLALEPGPRADWLAFLVLTTPGRIRDLLDTEVDGPG